MDQSTQILLSAIPAISAIIVAVVSSLQNRLTPRMAITLVLMFVISIVLFIWILPFDNNTTNGDVETELPINDTSNVNTGEIQEEEGILIDTLTKPKIEGFWELYEGQTGSVMGLVSGNKSQGSGNDVSIYIGVTVKATDDIEKGEALYQGIDSKNMGIISVNENFREGSTDFIGYTVGKQTPKSKELFVILEERIHHKKGFITTSPNYGTLKTKSIGWTYMPEDRR